MRTIHFSTRTTLFLDLTNFLVELFTAILQEKLFQSHFLGISLEMVAFAVCTCNSRVAIPIWVLFNLDSFVGGGHKEVEFLSMKFVFYDNFIARFAGVAQL